MGGVKSWWAGPGAGGRGRFTEGGALIGGHGPNWWAWPYLGAWPWSVGVASQSPRGGMSPRLRLPPCGLPRPAGFIFRFQINN